jgi:uncharacterized protein (DUF169 family)
MNISHVKERAKTLKEKRGITTFVGKFIRQGESTFIEDTVKLTGYRYCQTLMEARDGKHVIIDGEGISCPAEAFGFKQLPDGLKSGIGLIGPGIIKTKMQE